MSTFHLPDLGEGLPEAEIVRWHVKEGDEIKADEPLVSVETAKAVVEVPSPQSGVIQKLHAKDGDVVATGAPLVDFAGTEAGTTKKKKSKTNDIATVTPANQQAAASADSGTVVGSMPQSNQVLTDDAIIRKGKTGKGKAVKATPAVRALAKQLNVELGDIKPTGKQGQVTPNDVRSYAAGLQNADNLMAATMARKQPERTITIKPQTVQQEEPASVSEAPLISPDEMTSDDTEAALDMISETAASTFVARSPESTDKPVDSNVMALRGPRRTMAKSMSASRDQIAACTIFDDCDIHDWAGGQDITARIIRALCMGVRAEPSLNAWYNHQTNEKKFFDKVDLALAVDTDDGLIVPVLYGVHEKSQAQLRDALDVMKESTRARTVRPQDMRDPTMTLSNFGMMAGRYATPVVVPPQVAIIGTGGVRHDVVAVMGGVEVHRRIPLSLTFDHRCVTGGEACRFLAAVIEDLTKPT